MGLKRNFDIAASGIGIILSAPLTLGAAFVMAAVHHSNPIFIQKRVGLNGQTFNIIKIRTMNEARDETGQLLDDEHRTSLLGVFLRKSRIDELPQLINVLKGDMSLVGPRPVVLHGEEATDHKRHLVKPGLTGPAQIAGKNGLTKDEVLKLDHEYVDHHSFIGDLGMILETPISLIRNRNISHYKKGAQSCIAAPPPEHVEI